MFVTRPSHRTMSFTRVGLAAAALVVMTTIPNAHASDVSYDQMPPSYYALMKMKPAEVMHVMDPDKKGYVSKEDFMKFHQKMAENMFDKMDKNHNGRLEQSELSYPSYPLPNTDPELKKNLSE